MATAYIALGANLGDRLATLRAAVQDLQRFGAVTAASTVYETAPVGYLDQPAFLNAAARLDTDRSPRDLLAGLLRIEQERGRRRTFRNAPRTLDLDILLYGDRVVNEPGLTIPHPRLHERAFVLAPLAEIAAAVTHPTLGQTIGELWHALQPAAGAVQPYPGSLMA